MLQPEVCNFAVLRIRVSFQNNIPDADELMQLHLLPDEGVVVGHAAQDKSRGRQLCLLQEHGLACVAVDDLRQAMAIAAVGIAERFGAVVRILDLPFHLLVVEVHAVKQREHAVPLVGAFRVRLKPFGQLQHVAAQALPFVFGRGRHGVIRKVKRPPIGVDAADAGRDQGCQRKQQPPPAAGGAAPAVAHARPNVTGCTHRFWTWLNGRGLIACLLICGEPSLTH